MDEQVLTIGTLYIAKEVLQNEKWMLDQVITASMLQMRKYLGLDGFLRPSKVRTGDFSLVIADYKVSPIVVNFIGIPGRSRTAIVQELFVKT